MKCETPLGICTPVHDAWNQPLYQFSQKSSEQEFAKFTYLNYYHDNNKMGGGEGTVSFVIETMYSFTDLLAHTLKNEYL